MSPIVVPINGLSGGSAQTGAALDTPPSARPAIDLLEYLEVRDLNRAMALFSPAATFELVPTGLHGTAAVEGRAYFTDLSRAFPDLRIAVRSLAAMGPLTVLELTLEGTQAADFQGIVNQEKHLDLEQAWMVWTTGGHAGQPRRIERLRAYYCQNQLFRRLAVKRLDRVSITG